MELCACERWTVKARPRHVVMVMLIPVLLMMAACEASPAPETPAVEERAAPEAPEAQEEADAAAIRAEHLFPLEAWTRSFEMIDGDRAGEQLPLVLRQPDPDEPGEWVLEFDNLDTIYLQTDAQGDIEMVRFDLPAETFSVVYDPPVRLLPAEIRPHVRIEEESTAHVYDLETGELEHTGEVTHKVKFASRSRFASDVGEWEGYLIPIEHEIDLPRAHVRIDLAGGYVPELGVVYRRMDYTREAFLGLFGNTERRAAVLADDP